MSTKKKEVKKEGFAEGLKAILDGFEKEMKNVDIAAKFADNAFECSTKFTERIATRFNGYFSFIFVWLIVLSAIVLFK